jgi:hypothetical protein
MYVLMHLTNNHSSRIFLAFVMAIFLLPFSSAGLVELSINNSDDLLVSEDEIIFQEGTDLNLYVRLKGDLRNENSDKYVESIIINVNFNDDGRESLIGYPEYQPLCDTCEDPGYDEYLSKFRGNDERFDGYDGIINFAVTMKNNSNDIVWDDVLQITLKTRETNSDDSGGFSIPELPPAIEENLIPIVIGLLVVILLSVGIYTFVLAPEDTTADLYKPVESIDPLKKSLTGVGYESELPGKSKKLNRLKDSSSDDEEEEEEDEDEYEDDFDDEEDDKEFDERKILDELTGSHSIASGNDDENAEEEEEPKAAPVKKKAVKKRVAKKAVTKKVVKRPSTKTESNEPEISMGQGIKSIKCPSCSTVHNVDENTPKFICSCGRRIRV